MHFALVLLLLFSPLVTHALSLEDALRNQAGASQFAQRIESSAQLRALVRSGPLTVFAPADSNSSLADLRRRDTDDETQIQRQFHGEMIDIQDLSTIPGLVVETKDKSGNLDGAAPAVVAHSGLFGDDKIISDDAFTKRNIGNLTGKTITISSGLGKNVSIIRGDIAYDGGIIQVVDGFFTKPISLSATTNQTGNTQFSSRLSRSNLTRLLDNTPSITAFVPSNAAFVAAGNYTQTSARLASQLSNHIVTNQVLYLPRLVHGACYRTKAGNDITVTVKSGRYFINDAEIVQPDLILENGVAHIINKVITPAATLTPGVTPPIQLVSVNGSKIAIVNPTIVASFIIATVYLVYTLF